MALDLKAVLSAQNIVDYYKNTTRDIMSHPFLSLFPAKKQIGLDISYIEGADHAPVALRPSNFDAMAPIRGRNTVSQKKFSLPFFREEIPLTEKDRQDLLTYMAAGNAYVDAALADIYNDRANLLDGATATRIRMIGQALSTGSISYTEEGVTVAADYGFSSGTQLTSLTSTAQWNAPTTATPITDLLTAKRARNLGNCVAIMNQATWALFIATAEVKNAVYNGTFGLVLDADVKRYLSGLGISVLIVDNIISHNKYSVLPAGTETAFYPDNYVSLVPAQPLGRFFFGTTPEEADLRAGIGDISGIQIVDTGVAVTSLVNYGPPVKVSTVVSQVCLPSFETIGKMQIIHVTT